MEAIQTIVNGWENPRRIIIESDKVLFEVGLDHNHCGICASRHTHVRGALSNKGIPVVYHTDDDSRVFIVLPSAPPKEDVKRYIGATLNLSLR